MNINHRLLSGSALALAIHLLGPGVAQARQGAEPAPADDNVIIVTATRRASPLSDVPIAVSAVTSAALQNSGAADIRQLNQLAPSLLVSSTGSEANGVARIRGIGTVGDNPGLESSVAVFIDGVYRSRTGAGLNELGEVERIEVLRGPQGTLFGRNTSAGLINIVTKKPEFSFGANGELSYGNYNYWKVAAGVTGPITDKVAYRLDGVWSKRDGFYDLVNAAGAKTGETNDRDRYLLRGQLLLEPTDKLSIRLIGDYANRDESCCGAAYMDTSEKLPNGTTQANRIVTILNAISPGSVSTTPDPYSRDLRITAGREYVSKLRDWGLSGEVNYDFGGAKLTSITAYRDYKSRDYGDYDYSAADILYRDPNTYRQFRTFTQELRLQGSALADKLDWLVGGYYSHEDLTLVDNIRFGADYGKFAACRLMAGASATSALSAGQLAACASLPGVNALIAGTQSTLTPLVGATIAGNLAAGLTSLANISGGAGDTDARYRQKSTNWALFTHNIVHVTKRFDVTLGLRYTREIKNFSASLANNNSTCQTLQASSLPAYATNPALGAAAQLAAGVLTLGCLGNSSPALGALNLRDRSSHGEFSGTAVASYKLADRLMVYASYARGYKAGGYNLDRFELGNTGLSSLTSSPATYFVPRTDANSPASTLRFEPETVNAFELGLKYSSSKWSANAAIFRQAFKNFQLNTFNGTSFVVQNINGCSVALSAGTIDAGGQRCPVGNVVAGLISQGVELEVAVSPVRNLRLTGGYTYTEAKYRNVLVGSSDGQTPRDAALFLLPGHSNSNAPESVFTGSIAWTPPVGSNGLSALVYLDGRATSSYNTGSDLFPEKLQKGYAVFNGRLGLRGRDQRWAVELWGQNLFNEKYTQVTINSPLQSSSPSTATSGQFPAPTSAVMANQLMSAYLAEPRTFGVTVRGKF